MLKNKVKISDIISNQLPQFVQETYPLVSEFLKEYYKSQEIPGESLDLLNSIEQYLKLDNNSSIIEETILFKEDDPEYLVDIIDDVIYVKSVYGFNEKNGLIQIENEIITYKSVDKENNAFIGCVRGFSGIEEINSNKDLVFLSTSVDQHPSTNVVNGVSVPTVVKNLNILFLKEFLFKIKKQFAPGFDSREFYSDNFLKLNQNIFIKQSSDFYSSKGTDTSFKILFKALYGDEITIIKPKDFLIEPSSSEYRVTRDLVVERVSGDPLNLINRTLFQESSSAYSESYGSVTNVERITRDNKDYYIVSLDYDFDKDINVSGSVFGSFPIHPKTLCTDFIIQNSKTISVDSTVGFPNSGELLVSFDDEEIVITYESKSLNQFYDCNFITRDIPLGSEIKFNTSAFSYLNKDQTEKIVVRITGVLSDLVINDENNQLYDVGDTARIKYYGTEENTTLFNNWIYNIPVTYNILQEDLIFQGFLNNSYRYEILTKDENNIYNNESVEIDFIFEDNGLNIRIKKIFNEISVGSIPKKSIQITNDKPIVRVFSVRKIITKVKGFDFTANIQNTYKDKNNDLYVASPSLPNYFNENLSILDRSVTFNGYFSTVDNFNQNEVNSGDSSGELIIFRNRTGTVKRHGFITGDAVVYFPGSGDNKLTIEKVGEDAKNVYFVKKIDNNSIKLSLSKENLYNDIFLKVYGTTSQDQNKFVLYNFCNETLDQKLLGTQKIIRKIQDPVNSGEKYETKYGSLGIFANGVELLNYKSEDVIYSGKITDIEVAYGGEDYDIINPPILEVEQPIENESDSKATGIVSVEGSLKEIQILDGGFGYIEEPKIIISGGAGSGALAKANLVSFDHFIEFNTGVNSDINTSTNSIKLNIPHKFYNGERILYDSNNQQNVGSLINGQYYYVSVISSKEIKLHQTYDDAINNTNPKVLTNSIGLHFIRSLSQSKKIESITILNSGSGYKNNQRNVLGNEVILETNTITSKNHNYNSGDIIKYTNNNQPIGGLESGKSYYVTKIDSNNFKLSQINTESDNLDLFYKTNQYIKFTSTGEGIHIFNYPPITITVEGKKEIFTTSDQNFDAILRPIFRGSIKTVSITNDGFGYGTEEVINYNKQPTYQLVSGKGARVKPLIVDGKIKSVLIENAGSNYNTVPEIRIEGKGVGCKLVPILSQSGTISEIKVLREGVNYGDDTRINLISSGVDAKLVFKIQTWTINLVNRLIFNNQISADDGVLSRPLFAQNELQYTHAYSPKKLRQYVYSKKNEQGQIKYRTDLENDDLNTNFYHSPIIGWSYDGCPIYGPYGYESPSAANGGKVVQMRSGYNGYDGDTIQVKPNRPNVSIFPLGFFVEDYDFIDNGHLDEFNGRFCKTPEFPQGVYAYFLTVSEEKSDTNGFVNIKKPIFPYVIGNYFKFKPIDFNFSPDSNQDIIKIENQTWDRNTFVYNIDSEYSDYDFIYNSNKVKNQLTNVTSLKSGSIDNIRVAIPGNNYKISDPIIFDSKNKGSLYADVSSIEGKEVLKIESNAYSISNVEFISSVNSNQIIAFSPYPHNLLNSDRIFIKNLNKSVPLNDSYDITRIQNSLVLLNDVQDASITGIITYFNVFGNLKFPKIKENDIYEIDSEKIKILQIDEKNSRIKVQREYENTSSGFYSESSILLEQSRKLLFNIPIDTKINSTLNDEFYFEPKKSLILSDINSLQSSGTLFLEKELINTKVGVIKGTQTILTFDNLNDLIYFNSGYVDILNSTESLFNTSKKKIVSFGSTSITIDFNTNLYGGIGVTAYLNKWKTVDIPSNSIYLPDHNLNTNDILIYNVNSGIGITVFNGINTFQLEDQTELYVAKFSNDVIGISTNKVGLSTEGTFVGIGTTASILYFLNYGEGNNHSFKTRRSDTVIGNIISNKSTIYTKEPHGLSVNDNVSISCNPENQIIIPIEFDSATKKLLVDRKNIIPSNINIFTNTITITNHGYFNGEKVLYKTTNNSIGGLVNGETYYVNVVDFNTIKLSSSYYNSTLSNPITLELTSVPSGEGFLYKINPELNLIKNNKVIFDLSSSTLSFFNGIESKSAFDFKLFYDDKFLYEYVGEVTENNSFQVLRTGTIGVTTDAKIELDIKNILQNKLYYRLVPTKESNKIVYNDIENISFPNSINFVDSAFNGNYSVIGISSSGSFSVSLEKNPESVEYDNNINYTTTSTSALGPIDKISIKLNGGNSLKKLPIIEGIASKNGSSAVLYPESKEIGKISSTKIIDIGFNYPIDNSLTPKFKFPSILKIEPLSSIQKINVNFVGNNYTIPPKLILIDSFTNKVVNDVILDYDIENRKVLILQNTKGIYNISPKIIPVNNSNGISIKSLEYDPISKKVTAILNAYYSSIDDYPFEIGDKIFIEGVRNIGNEKGFNSSSYNYAFFTVTKLENLFGTLTSTVEYDFSEYENPGIFDPECTSGSLCSQKDFPTFSVILTKNNFLIGENVISDSGETGVVETWDSANELLKVETTFDFNSGQLIKGSVSGSIGEISKSIFCDGKYEISSSSIVNKGWNNEKGFLNSQFQKIHDSDYYQYFSYSIKSNTEVEKWKDAVSTLNHTAGFKKFSDLNIQSIQENAGISTDQNIGTDDRIIDVIEAVNLNCVNDFDLVTENNYVVDGNLSSDQIYFNSKELQDYSESKGNRVLTIDDISYLFNTIEDAKEYITIDKFLLKDFNSKKYILFVNNKLVNSENQVNVLTLLHDQNNVYLNQYAKIWSKKDLGSFDCEIVAGSTEVNFYPISFEFDDYNISYINYGFDKNLTELGFVNFGNVAKFFGNEKTIVGLGTTTLFEIDSVYRVVKILNEIEDSTSGIISYNEITLINDGNTVHTLEYGNLSNSSVGFGTYSAYISGDTIKVDFIPNQYLNSVKCRSSIIVISNFTYTSVGTEYLITSTVSSQSASISQSPSPSLNDIAFYTDDNNAAYYIISIEDTTNNRYQVSEIILVDDGDQCYFVEYGTLYTDEILGTFDATRLNNEGVYLQFEPLPNIDVEIRMLQSTIRLPNRFSTNPSLIV